MNRENEEKKENYKRNLKQTSIIEMHVGHVGRIHVLLECSLSVSTPKSRCLLVEWNVL